MKIDTKEVEAKKLELDALITEAKKRGFTRDFQGKITPCYETTAEFWTIYPTNNEGYQFYSENNGLKNILYLKNTAICCDGTWSKIIQKNSGVSQKAVDITDKLYEKHFNDKHKGSYKGKKRESLYHCLITANEVSSEIGNFLGSYQGVSTYKLWTDVVEEIEFRQKELIG